MTGKLDWDSDALYWRFLTSGYSRSAAHTQWSDASPYEIAAGGGYTAGGFPASGASASLSGLVSTFTISHIEKQAVGGEIAACRWAILVDNKTVDGMVDPLLIAVLLDTTSGGTDLPATLEGAYLRVLVNLAGLYRITVT
jgi:hypothetical protein